MNWEDEVLCRKSKGSLQDADSECWPGCEYEENAFSRGFERKGEESVRVNLGP
jgi:hypothetical protein